MISCRIQLRVPGLSNPENWVSSISICMHAATGVLSSYFELYSPALHMLSSRISKVGLDATETSILPPTWRQVKRIVLCIFIVILAYWRGEVAFDEASRHLAVARLCLEYPRSKWGNKLREAILVITDISHVAGFRLHEHMQALLPAKKPDFPLPMEGEKLCPVVDSSQPLNDFVTMSGTSLPDEGLSRLGTAFSSPQWHGSLPNLDPAFSEFDFSDEINIFSFWQLTEEVSGDAMLL